MSVFARMMGQRAPAMGGPLGMASAGGIVATPEQNARQAALEAQFGINPLAGARVPDVPMQTVDVPASGGAPVGASPFGRIEVNQPGAGSPFNPATLQRSLGQIEGMTPEVKAGGGVFARIGDFLGSDEGRAALLRSGAATLQGGLGAGIAAGAGFVDQRHREAAQQAERDRQFGLQSRGVDIKQQQADNQSMNVASQIRDRAIQQGIDVAKLDEARRKARAGEALDAQELASLNWYRQVQAGWCG